MTRAGGDFFSALRRAVQGMVQEREMDPAAVLRALEADQTVKREEVVWSGLQDFLTREQNAGSRVTRADMNAWLDANEVRVYEVPKGTLPRDRAEQDRLSQNATQAQQRFQALRGREAVVKSDLRHRIADVLLSTPELRAGLLRMAQYQGASRGWNPSTRDVLEEYDELAALARRPAAQPGQLRGPAEARDLLDNLRVRVATVAGESLLAERPGGDPYEFGYHAPFFSPGYPDRSTPLLRPVGDLKKEWQDYQRRVEDAQTAYRVAQALEQPQPRAGGLANWVRERWANLPGASPDTSREFLLVLGGRQTPGTTAGQVQGTPGAIPTPGAEPGVLNQVYPTHWDEPNVLLHVRVTDRRTRTAGGCCSSRRSRATGTSRPGRRATGSPAPSARPGRAGPRRSSGRCARPPRTPSRPGSTTSAARSTRRRCGRSTPTASSTTAPGASRSWTPRPCLQGRSGRCACATPTGTR